jgi:hypothetical protein
MEGNYLGCLFDSHIHVGRCRGIQFPVGISEERYQLVIIIFITVVNSGQSFLEAFLSVEIDIVMGDETMVVSGDQGVFLRGATHQKKHSKKQCRVEKLLQRFFFL